MKSVVWFDHLLYSLSPVNGHAEPETSAVTMIVRPINDCPFVLVEDEVVHHMDDSFAAYVNQQHPYLDKLLCEALDIGVVDSFSGYLNKDPARVICETYALWDLLVARDTRYRNITSTVSEVEHVGCQHVRLIEDAVDNNQANCVDGSILLVSLLRKIGIDAWLVLEPGHCYMLFWTDRENTQFLALETTALGSEFEPVENVPDSLLDAVAADKRGHHSWNNFVLATLSATQKIHRDSEKFDERITHKMISIGKARQNGVMPIPFRGKLEGFKEYDYLEYISENFGEALADSGLNLHVSKLIRQKKTICDQEIFCAMRLS